MWTHVHTYTYYMYMCVLCIYIHIVTILYIRKSVDSLYRDGADAQYIQYLSKSHETQPQMRFKL